jgi:cytoskeletal protein RodZ
MPYPNNVLSAWQLAVIAVVAVGCLSVWLIAVYLAAREPRQDRAARASSGASPGETTTSAAAGSVRAAAAGEPEPTREAGSPRAA